MPGSRIRLAWPTASPAATVGGMRRGGSRDGSTATTPGARSSSRARVLEIEALEPPGQQQDEKWLVHRCRTL